MKILLFLGNSDTSFGTRQSQNHSLNKVTEVTFEHDDEACGHVYRETGFDGNKVQKKEG